MNLSVLNVANQQTLINIECVRVVEPIKTNIRKNENKPEYVSSVAKNRLQGNLQDVRTAEKRTEKIKIYVERKFQERNI